MTSENFSYHAESVPNDQNFRELRTVWRQGLADDAGLRRAALQFQEHLDHHHYTYQFEWLGVPIVRLPDDIAVFQEIVFAEQPDTIIETGVARGGSLVLSASLQEISGLAPRVLGIDLNIFPHTRLAIENSRYSPWISLLEGDSRSEEVHDVVAAFVRDSRKVLLVLDSDHSHSHVLGELASLSGLLPIDSLILVADTIVEEMPIDYYPNRHWGAGNSPLSALREFLAFQDDYQLDPNWCRRAIVTEFRDGIIRRGSTDAPGARK